MSIFKNVTEITREIYFHLNFPKKYRELQNNNYKHVGLLPYFMHV